MHEQLILDQATVQPVNILRIVLKLSEWDKVCLIVIRALLNYLEVCDRLLLEEGLFARVYQSQFEACARGNADSSTVGFCS